MKNLCVIPARGGSKRIPKKNIKDFCKKPMISWSINNALISNLFSDVVVSTDDSEIAKIAEFYGANIPFIRPKNLADDHADTKSVVMHAITWFNEQEKFFDYVCCLYPTAPLLDYNYLDLGFKKLLSNSFDFIVSVAEFNTPPQRALRLNSDGRLQMIDEKFRDKRSQDLERTYYDAGQFYWGTSESWLKNKSIFSNNSFPLVLPRHMAQDINTLSDWEFTERLYESILR